MIKYCSIPVHSHEYKKHKLQITLLFGHCYRIFRFVKLLQCVACNNPKLLSKHIETARTFENIHLLLWPILFWIDICLRNVVNIIITKPYIWISIIAINVVSFLSKSYVHYDTLRSCHFLTPSFGHSLHRNKWKRYRF